MTRPFHEAMRDIRDIAARTRAAMFTPPAAPIYHVCLCTECGREFSSQVRTDKQCRNCRHTEAAMHGPMDRSEE